MKTDIFVFDEPPKGFLDVSLENLAEILPGPSLIQIEGKRKDPLFISTLLHGNETSGFLALQAILRKYKNRELPRSLTLFIGNIDAATANLRKLPNQMDFNRIWQGGEEAEQKFAQTVLDLLKTKQLFACIDIHNSTGRNPHYACVNDLSPQFIHLARLFSRIVVYFTRPPEVLSNAFAKLCPSVTIESGRPGEPAGIAHVCEYIDACLHLSEIPTYPTKKDDILLYQSLARVKVKPECFETFHIRDDLDHMNFREIESGTSFGRTDAKELPLTVMHMTDTEVSDQFFEVRDGQVVNTRPVVPSLFTQDQEIIRTDCLGYLMEHKDAL